MFSGIVEAAGEVLATGVADRVVSARISLPPRWRLSPGQSVSVNGICTTVVSSGKGSFTAEYMPETLRKTTAGAWAPGTRVNLERSLRLGDRIDGQLLSGHVDGVAKVTKVAEEGASRLVEVALPARFAKSVALHGWIALDGVSLTVARKRGLRASVALVPFTLKRTTLASLSPGSLVNLETERARLPAHASPAGRRGPEGRLPARRRPRRR